MTDDKPTPTQGEGVVGEKQEEAPADFERGVKFWGILVALSILAFNSALDVSIITTALPTIVSQIGGDTLYVWIANSFVIASSVVQPLFGQLADILGRRVPFLASIIFFMLGSGIAGGASSAGMLIAGRTVQGVGAGGIYVLLDIICCDLVPLRERGKYLGIMFSWSGVAAGIGPVIGGALAQANWRWIFYMNLPICGVALAATLLFMRVNTGGSATAIPWRAKAARVDWLGNAIFIPSIFAVLYGLITGGVQHPWSSWRTLLPLILGLAGWAAFHAQQHWLARYPSVSSRLFADRTSAIGYVLNFISSVTVQSVLYFLPVYFQAVLGTTILRSGVYFLPTAIGTLFAAVFAGALMSNGGAYRLIHAGSFALAAIGFGLFTTLDARTSKAEWAVYQLIAAFGNGMTLSTLLPAIMAPMRESDVAAATAAFNFIKTFGYVWGVTVPSILFNSVFNRHLSAIADPTLRSQLHDGQAYSFAATVHDLKRSLPAATLAQMDSVYSRALQSIWWFGLGFALLGLVLVAGERHVELRTELETEYGITNAPAADGPRGLEENAAGGDKQGVPEAKQESLDSRDSSG